jgi:hypothetical protein
VIAPASSAPPRYTPPQPIPGTNTGVIPLPRLPSLDRTTALPVQPANYYLISARPALVPTPPRVQPAILDNDGWQPARD